MSLVKIIKATYTIGVRLAGDTAIWALSKIETMTDLQQAYNLTKEEAQTIWDIYTEFRKGDKK